jgi:DNA-binding NarL/FixJ family response regulator
MKILFVENHEQFVRVVAGKFLADHEITVAPSIVQAWDKLTAASFNVVLVDYDLDDGKGDQLVNRIRRHSLPIRVVAVSSHDDGNKALLKAGADAVCSKLEFERISEVLSTLAEE